MSKLITCKYCQNLQEIQRNGFLDPWGPIRKSFVLKFCSKFRLDSTKNKEDKFSVVYQRRKFVKK